MAAVSIAMSPSVPSSWVAVVAMAMAVVTTYMTTMIAAGPLSSKEDKGGSSSN